MPKANWGISANDVDDFDRESQYKPYGGPIPPLGVYRWQIKVLKYAPATKTKNPQIRLGIELIPRAGFDEKKYKGYFIMAFLPIVKRAEFRYVPLLDTLGVSGREFENSTQVDAEGNIKRIGKWRNDGQQEILAQIKEEEYTDKSGTTVLQRTTGFIGEVPDDIEDEDDEYDDEEIDEYEEEETDEEDDGYYEEDEDDAF